MATASSTHRPVVLYVEDTVQQRVGTAELLEDEFEVLDAGTAEEGLRIADREGHRIDVALIDRMMPQPGMQGDQLATLLAERGHRVVVLSAKKGSGHRKEMLGPAIVYVEKPVDPDELIAQLRVVARLRFVDQVSDALNALATAALRTTGSFGNGLSAADHINLGAIAASQRPFVTALVLSARGLRAALDQLATFCRLRLGRVEPDPVWIDLATLVAQCDEGGARDRTARDVRIAIQAAPASVWADVGLLRIALDAMLAHATAAADFGSEIIVCAPTTDSVRVRYQGTGLSTDALARLFEPAPLDDLTHPERDFGLAWVNAAMATTAQGATITAASDGPRAGATFTVHLAAPPAAEVAAM